MLRSVLFGGGFIYGFTFIAGDDCRHVGFHPLYRFHAYHVALFWIAFALISASTLLGPVAEGTVDSPLRLFIAVTMPLLPAVHATWALAVWMHPSEARSNDLKSFGTIPWASWLILHLTGLFLGFANFRLGDIPALALSTMAVLAILLCFRDSGHSHQNV